MHTNVVSESEWLVVGMSFYGDPLAQSPGWDEDNEIGRLWKRFMAFKHRHPGAIMHLVDPNVALEIHLYTEETAEKGLFEVFVGVRVSRLEDVPLECTVKMLPATDYAICTLHGDEITSDWGKLIYQDWLPASGYRSAADYAIQAYDARFKGLDQIAGSVLDVYVPVEKTG